MDALSQRLQRLFTGIVFDMLSDLGRAAQVLPPSIRPLDPGKGVLAGPVWTVTGVPTPNISKDDSLLKWTEFLSAAPAGHVVLCQPNDSRIAHMGELSAETLKTRGILGYIVDGGCRDVRSVVDMGFPTFCRYVTPFDIVGRWRVDEMGGAIRIGEVIVRTGDYVIADQDGVVIIPGEHAEEVVAAAEKAAQTENHMRDAILAGMSPRDAYLKYGKF